MYRLLGLILAVFSMMALGGCQTSRKEVAAPQPVLTVEEEPVEVEAWRGVATEQDAQLLDALPAVWKEALGEVRRRYRRALTAEGELLDPETRLKRPAPAPGTYRCRAIRIGSRSTKVPPWSVSRSGFCYVGVSGEQLSFASEIVGTRIGGYLWDVKEGDNLVFLGATVPARTKTAPPYGANPSLDWAGLVERTDEFHYRLTLPRRTGDNRLIVIELIAAPDA